MILSSLPPILVLYLPNILKQIKMADKNNMEIFLDDARKTFDECLKILSSKNHDYSELMDPFSNFKVSARVASISPAQAALVLVGTKISRLTQLVGNGKNPMNEKTQDTIVDLINYLMLLKGILDEQNEGTAQSVMGKV